MLWMLTKCETYLALVLCCAACACASAQPVLQNPPPPASYPYVYTPAQTVPYGYGYIYQPAVVHVQYRVNRPRPIFNWLLGPVDVWVPFPQQPSVPPPQQ